MKPAKRDYSHSSSSMTDLASLSSWSRYLRQRGHPCYALTDWLPRRPALASENDCEVAIVDLKMPKVDGISLISLCES